MTARHVDHEIARLARRQFGAFSRRQVHHVGGSDGIIRRRVDAGTWDPLAPAVFALRGVNPTWHRALMAAVLGEPDAVASGRAAAVLHGLLGYRPGRVEITVPRASNHRSTLSLVHQSDLVHATSVSGIPTTTVAQTFVDIAASSSMDRLAGALDNAILRNLVTIDALASRYVDLRFARRGGAKIRHLIETRGITGYTPPASELERLLYAMLDNPDIPPFVRQAPFPWRGTSSERTDAWIPSWQLIVEGDGRLWHARVADFERDRRRDNEAAAHGIRVLRFAWADLRHDPEACIDVLVRAGHANLVAEAIACGKRGSMPQPRGDLRG